MQTKYLTVTGMKSGGSMSKVAEVLNTLPGVGDVKASLADGEVTINFNERRISVAQLTSAVEEAGYGVDGAVSVIENPVFQYTGYRRASFNAHSSGLIRRFSPRHF